VAEEYAEMAEEDSEMADEEQEVARESEQDISSKELKRAQKPLLKPLISLWTIFLFVSPSITSARSENKTLIQ
jgi:hypothetical protein